MFHTRVKGVAMRASVAGDKVAMSEQPGAVPGCDVGDDVSVVWLILYTHTQNQDPSLSMSGHTIMHHIHPAAQ